MKIIFPGATPKCSHNDGNRSSMLNTKIQSVNVFSMTYTSMTMQNIFDYQEKAKSQHSWKHDLLL